MPRINLNALWTWPLLALLVLAMMSFQDPLRIAVVAVLLSVHGPMWRWIHGLEHRIAKPQRVATRR